LGGRGDTTRDRDDGQDSHGRERQERRATGGGRFLFWQVASLASDLIWKHLYFISLVQGNLPYIKIFLVISK